MITLGITLPRAVVFDLKGFLLEPSDCKTPLSPLFESSPPSVSCVCWRPAVASIRYASRNDLPMLEKIRNIKNPLTMIAIFASLAEVGGTIVLPFLTDNNQTTFMWFLILFPSFLLVSFILTLNFNPTVLYAPSDYKEDSSYLIAAGKMKAADLDLPVNF